MKVIRKFMCIVLAVACVLSNQSFLSIAKEQEKQVRYKTYDGNEYEVEFEIESTWKEHFKLLLVERFHLASQHPIVIRLQNQQDIRW